MPVHTSAVCTANKPLAGHQARARPGVYLDTAGLPSSDSDGPPPARPGVARAHTGWQPGPWSKPESRSAAPPGKAWDLPGTVRDTSSGPGRTCHAWQRRPARRRPGPARPCGTVTPDSEPGTRSHSANKYSKYANNVLNMQNMQNKLIYLFCI